MKKTGVFFLVLSILLGYSNLLSQNEDYFSPKFRAVKIVTNSNFDFQKNPVNFISLLRTFSPAIAWGKEYGNFHEITVQDFGFLLTEGQNSFRSTVNYSYNLRVGKYNPEKNVNFFVGGGALVGGAINTSTSQISTEFPSRQSTMRFDLVLTPRMTINLGKRTFLNVSIPYSVHTIDRNSVINENPSVPLENRKTVGVKSSTFPNQFTVRVGVAFKF
jgi:hypothetical protein